MAKSMTYTDPHPVEQPTKRLEWEMGMTHPVDDDLAEEWDADDRSPFSGERKKAAREARAVAAIEQAPAVDETPAESAGGEASS